MEGLDRFRKLASKTTQRRPDQHERLTEDEAEELVEMAQRILDECDAPSPMLFERAVQQRLGKIERKLALLMRTVAALGEHVIKRDEMPWPRPAAR